jgi:hypothetical protein
MKTFRYFGKAGIVVFPDGKERMVVPGTTFSGDVAPSGSWTEVKAALQDSDKAISTAPSNKKAKSDKTTPDDVDTK